MGSSAGNAERITLRLDERITLLSIELPPSTPPNAEELVTSVLREQGWSPGKARVRTDAGASILGYRPSGMTRTLGWNRNELRIDLDRLAGGLRRLGGRPVFFAIRTSDRLEWSVQPPPRSGGLFQGSRVGFWRLQESGNGVLVLRYHVPTRPAWAVLASAIAWFLFPLLAALAVRFAYRPKLAQPSPAGSDPWRKTVVALRWVTAAGAYATLFFQNDVLKLIWLPISGISPPFNRLSMWVMPFCFVLYTWAGSAWSLAGPVTPESRLKLVFKTLAIGAGSVILYLLIIASTTFGIAIRDPFWGLRWILGGILVITGGTLLFGWRRMRSLRMEAAEAEEKDGPIPASDEGRRELLKRIQERLATPEEESKHEERLKKLPANLKAFGDLSRQLTYEERSWLVLSDRLSLQSKGSPAKAFHSSFLYAGSGLVLVGIACFFLPVLAGLLLAFGSLGVMGWFFKRLGRQATEVSVTMGGDIQVARLLDDPQRLLEVLRRMESVEAQEGGTKTEFAVTRRRALEGHLLQTPSIPRGKDE